MVTIIKTHSNYDYVTKTLSKILVLQIYDQIVSVIHNLECQVIFLLRPFAFPNGHLNGSIENWVEY
jgi:hypothetical protein